MAITYQVFTDVCNAALGGAAINGVVSVQLVKRREEFRAGGDGELYETVAEAGPCSIAGTIVTLDPAAAGAIDGLAGTLSFVWKDAKGAADRTVTVSNVQVTGTCGAVGGNKASSASISFIASSSDGLADPVSIA